MNTHTKLLLVGAVVFALPIPGTFILGALILLTGTALYWLRE
ncbi:hypothetical protein [Salarchaeum sp. JOR-1]|nr:hypothetical protein [Salarchaeum sp. JOR-1]